MAIRGRSTPPVRTATVARLRLGESWAPPSATAPPPLTQPATAREPRPWEIARPPGDKAYRPGLDGLRALAVIGVLLYHAGVHWMPGGLLGVDLFFVISGFLITSLLITELQRTGGIALAAFYARRARRLLPALATVLGFVLVALALFERGDLVRFRGDVAASLAYVTNWWFIVQHRSYFVASGRPSPFQHLWSLAVEEQFYILWPLLLLALWRRLTRAKSLAGARGRTAARSLARIGCYAFGAATLSAGWMAYIAVRQNLPYGADTSRVYYGTDTHASALLLGVAAAAFLAASYGPIWQRRPRLAARMAFDVAGVGGLIAVSLAMLRANEFSPGLYRGGFFLFAAAAAVGVTAVSRPGGLLESVLGSSAGRWVGTRSYGLYLWHWPVFVYTRPQLDVPLMGTGNVVLRLALTVALAEASYRFVERPIRALGFRPWLQQWAHLRRPGLRTVTNRSWRRAVGTWTMVAGFLIGSAAVPLLGYGMYQLKAQSAQGRPLVSTSAGSHPHATSHHKVTGATTPEATVSPVAIATPITEPEATPDAAVVSDPVTETVTETVTATVTATVTPTVTATATPPPPPPPALPDGHTITAIGDSVMLGAVSTLNQALPGATVNAVEGRQASGAFTLLNGLIDQGHLGPNLVLHIGTNGTIDPRALDSLLAKVPDRHVIVLNLHVPRPWQDLNNAILTAAVRNHPNVRLLDWNAAASAHPEWLYNDGIHLRPAGAAAYRDLILSALRQGG